ncbi:MAG: hypothetical protein CVU63_04225 [Deltaproteobacteria bacterium HGW-Deltaproteobacteria-20]|jgi:GNAT superfamily N-acetyltransferase|nr:MAG: hypothetical protein CVU63_04225 [Deltaproteobacteria bacterium HGW-Deltaproteobacteria-20]
MSGLSLTHTCEVRHDPVLRAAFYALTQKVFHFSLERWHDAGFWTHDYVCHSLLDGNSMVANASTTRMALHIEGRTLPATQVGTVATLPEARNRGLARRLMQEIVSEHGREPMFLFANDSVVDFYPQFGFRRGPLETMPVFDVEPRAQRKADADDAGEYWVRAAPTDQRVVRQVEANIVRSRRFGISSPSIAMFHLLSRFSDGVFLSPDGVFVLVGRRTGDRLDVIGLFASEAPDPERLLSRLSLPGVRQLRFHFEPDGLGLASKRADHRLDDSHLFVNDAFPTLSGPWIFPTLAYT